MEHVGNNNLIIQHTVFLIAVKKITIQNISSSKISIILK